MGGKTAENAGMGQSVMAQGKKNDFDAYSIKTGRPSLGADEEGLSFVSDAMKNGIDLFTISVAPKVKE